jgi:2-polyprenyl-6-methoxyphenol hydroxylase-like FAD-dependent oxidoreductase
VLIVGAGPTGLLLGGDLALAGISVVVLDREPAASGLSRAVTVQPRTLEQLDARGLADPLVSTGHPVSRLCLSGRKRCSCVDLSALPSRFPYLLITPQQHTERLLVRRARSAGARISAATEVTGIRQDHDGVEVHAMPRAGPARRWQAQYLIGADGAGSTVRRALRLPFPGRPVFGSLLAADVRLSRPPPDAVTAGVSADGLVLIIPFGDAWHRVMAWSRWLEWPVPRPVELSEISQVTDAVLGQDFGMQDARWAARLPGEERRVPQYQSGRVLLAGDAAHAHVPLAGQGLNAGLQDAANLSWKLAAVLHGTADPGLLASYDHERQHAGSPAQRLIQNVFRPAMLEPGWIQPAAGLATRVRPLADRIARAICGLDVRYPGRSRLAGQRAPDLELRSGWHRRLYEALRDGRFVLAAGPQALASSELPALLAQWPGRVQLVEPVAPLALLLLVRPDGYVAWASSDSSPVRRYAGLRQALGTWCGPPAGRPVTTLI